MERRPYFLVGDLSSNASVGALGGLAVNSLVGETWPVVFGMVIWMCLGDLVALPVAGVLSVLFGAMEVMLPVMLTGMLTGMLVGMAATMSVLSDTVAAGLGAIVGLLVLSVTYALNAYLKAGRQRR